MHDISPLEIFKKSFSVIRENFKLIAVSALVVTSSVLLPSLAKAFWSLYTLGFSSQPSSAVIAKAIASVDPAKHSPSFSFADLICIVIGLFLTRPLMIGFTRVVIEIRRQADPSFDSLFFPFGNGLLYYFRCTFSSFVVALLLLAWSLVGVLSVVVPSLIFGLLFSKIAGLIVAFVLGTVVLIFLINKAFNYILTPFVIAADEEINIFSAIKRSTALIQNHQWSFFFLTCLIGIIILPLFFVSAVAAIAWMFMLYSHGATPASWNWVVALSAFVFLSTFVTEMIGIVNLTEFFLQAESSNFISDDGSSTE